MTLPEHKLHTNGAAIENTPATALAQLAEQNLSLHRLLAQLALEDITPALLSRLDGTSSQNYALILEAILSVIPLEKVLPLLAPETLAALVLAGSKVLETEKRKSSDFYLQSYLERDPGKDKFIYNLPLAANFPDETFSLVENEIIRRRAGVTQKFPVTPTERELLRQMLLAPDKQVRKPELIKKYYQGHTPIISSAIEVYFSRIRDTFFELLDPVVERIKAEAADVNYLDEEVYWIVTVRKDIASPGGYAFRKISIRQYEKIKASRYAAQKRGNHMNDSVK